jgi:hypothetical protein
MESEAQIHSFRQTEGLLSVRRGRWPAVTVVFYNIWIYGVNCGWIDVYDTSALLLVCNSFQHWFNSQNQGWYSSPIFVNCSGLVAPEIRFVTVWMTGTVMFVTPFIAYSCDKFECWRGQIGITVSLSILHAIVSARLTIWSICCATLVRKMASTNGGRPRICNQAATSSLLRRQSCCSRSN